MVGGDTRYFKKLYQEKFFSQRNNINFFTVLPNEAQIDSLVGRIIN